MRFIIAALVMINGLLFITVLAQSSTQCGRTANPNAATFNYSYEPDEDTQAKFNTQILNYLNAKGSAEGLYGKLLAAVGEGNGGLVVTAQQFEADFTGAGKNQLLVSIDVAVSNGYSHIVSLFTCQDSHFVLLSSFLIANEFDVTEAPGASIAAVIDVNDNHHPQILVRATKLQGQHFFETISLYEWNGVGLAQVFSADNRLGRFGSLQVENIDDKPTLLLQDRYCYGQETAMAFIELHECPNTMDTYYWNGAAWTFKCAYLTDMPTALFEALQSAETYLACGYDDRAAGFYQMMIDDPTLQRWTQTQIFRDNSSAVPSDLASHLEESYLIAFAYYRLVQLRLNAGDLPGAQKWVDQVQAKYQTGLPGYQYAAMTETLLKTYIQSHNLSSACQAAKVTFDVVRAKGDDPGIQKALGLGTATQTGPTGFYFASGKSFSPDPDDLFGEFGDLMTIPVCLPPLS